MKDPIIEISERWRRLLESRVKADLREWLAEMQINHPLAFKSYSDYSDELSALAKKIVKTIEDSNAE